MKIAKKDIPAYTGSDGWTEPEKFGAYSVRVKVDIDEYPEPPWENDDGRGIVTGWERRAKKPYERILIEDRGSKRFYDVQASIEKAKRDGWDAPPYQTGTKGERAARAVEQDFKFLRGWCNGDWQYLVVTTEVSRGAEVIDRDVCGGIEGNEDYWREFAADHAQYVINADAKARREAALARRIEKRERAYWAARDIVTVE